MDLHIKDVLKKYIKQDKRIGDAYYSQKIREFWAAQFNESITSRTCDINYHNGKLRVRVTSAPLRHELFMSRERIIGLVNEYVKEDIVRVLELS